MGFRIQIQPFLGPVWPSRGLAQNGEGIDMGAGSPWPAVWSPMFFYFRCETFPQRENLEK